MSGVAEREIKRAACCCFEVCLQPIRAVTGSVDFVHKGSTDAPWELFFYPSIGCLSPRIHADNPLVTLAALSSYCTTHTYTLSGDISERMRNPTTKTKIRKRRLRIKGNISFLSGEGRSCGGQDWILLKVRFETWCRNPL